MRSRVRVQRAASNIKRWCVLLPASAILLACSQAPVQIPPHEPPKPIVSYINVPITIPLAAIEKTAEADVPKQFNVQPFEKALEGGANPPACGVDVGYSVGRGPIVLSGEDKTIVSGIDLSYWLQGRKQVPCPGELITASCGTNGEAYRTATVGIDSNVTIQPNLSVAVQSKLRPAVPGERCVLHPVEYDITDTLMKGLDTSLSQMLPTLDKKVAAALDLRSRMQAAWARMSEPREVRPSIWLSWNPEGLGVVPVTVSDGAIHTGIQLRMRPVITAGAKPAVTPKPLPLAYQATRDDTFKLQLPVDVEEPFVQSRLDKALDIDKGGMPLTIGSQTVHITSAELTGEGTQVLIKLVFTGDMRGNANLIGTPYYNAETRTLSFPDLDYTLDSDQFLLTSANFLAHSRIRDTLREKFTIELGDKIDQLKGGLEGLLNRRNGNVQLHGTLEELTLLGVLRQPGADVFTAYLSATGKLSAEIEPE
jgi:hypothetical protein